MVLIVAMFSARRKSRKFSRGTIPESTRNRLTCVRSSFVSVFHSSPSQFPSKATKPLLPLRQLPVIFNSSIVWMFWT